MHKLQTFSLKIVTLNTVSTGSFKMPKALFSGAKKMDNPLLKAANAEINSNAMATLLDTTSSLIVQAEALLGTCRALLEQTRLQRTNQIGDRGLERTAEPSAGLTEWPGPEALTVLSQSSEAPRNATLSYAINVDVLELFRSKFPSLSRGEAIVCVMLIAHCGRIVTHEEFKAILKTRSPTSVRFYIHRIRSALSKWPIDVPILSLRGGYGMSTEAAEKLVDSLGFTALEQKRIASATIVKARQDSAARD